MAHTLSGFVELFNAVLTELGLALGGLAYATVGTWLIGLVLFSKSDDGANLSTWRKWVIRGGLWFALILPVVCWDAAKLIDQKNSEITTSYRTQQEQVKQIASLTQQRDEYKDKCLASDVEMGKKDAELIVLRGRSPGIKVVEKSVKTSPDIQQKSSGANSPNIVGDNNIVNPKPLPRTLDDKQRKKLLAQLKMVKHPPAQVIVGSPGNPTEEQSRFCKQLVEIFSEAGWKSLRQPNYFISDDTETGLVIFSHVEPDAKGAAYFPADSAEAILHEYFQSNRIEIAPGIHLLGSGGKMVVMVLQQKDTP
jgi:hypothetical protein